AAAAEPTADRLTAMGGPGHRAAPFRQGTPDSLGQIAVTGCCYRNQERGDDRRRQNPRSLTAVKILTIKAFFVCMNAFVFKGKLISALKKVILDSAWHLACLYVHVP